MAGYVRETTTEVRVEFRVPTTPTSGGASHGDVVAAIHAAVNELSVELGYDPLDADDCVTVRAADGAIVVSYEHPNPLGQFWTSAARQLADATGVAVDLRSEYPWHDALDAVRRHAATLRELHDRRARDRRARFDPFADGDPIPALLPRNWPSLVASREGNLPALQALVDGWVLAAVLDGEVPPGPREPVGESGE